MKIQFCGTGGSGKTTLMNDVATAMGLKPLPSITRIVGKNHGIEQESDQWKMSEYKRWLFQADLFNKVDNYLLVSNDYVSDRSMIDSFCYAIWKSGTEIDNYTVDKWTTRVETSLKDVDLLVYCGMDAFIPPDDQYRSQVASERRLMDLAMYGMFLKVDVRCRLAILHEADQTVRLTEVVALASHNTGVVGVQKVI